MVKVKYGGFWREFEVFLAGKMGILGKKYGIIEVQSNVILGKTAEICSKKGRRSLWVNLWGIDIEAYRGGNGDTVNS